MKQNFYTIFFKLVCIAVYLMCVACNNSDKNAMYTSAKSKVEDTINVIPASSTAITPLPFGHKPTNIKNVSLYRPLSDETGKHRAIYNLPDIKSVNYFVADSEDNIGLCYEVPKNENIKLTKYQYQLPDYKGFKVYYMSGDSASSTTLKEEFSIDCDTDYGNLIVYNTKSQTASVITIYYSFYIDSAQQRCFYIDEKFNIYMADEFFTDGDNCAEHNPKKVYRANINNQGSFSTKVIFDPDK